MNQDLITGKMKELEENIIKYYKFKDINNLATAMSRKKIPGGFGGKNNKTYENEYYALLGDSIITTVITEYLHDELGLNVKGELTVYKKSFEENKTFYNISINTGIINYAYNEYHFHDLDLPKHEKVSINDHDSFVEAIVGAIYLDGGFCAAKDWILIWLLDKLSSKLIDLKNILESRELMKNLYEKSRL